MFTVTREQAEITFQRAYKAVADLKQHLKECRKCVTEQGERSIPCELGTILESGTRKICREAEHALTAYLPAGSTVTYHGTRPAYRDRVWIVAGPNPAAPWKGYTLVGPGDARPFVATFPSLRISSREAQRREQAEAAQQVVTPCLAVLSAYGETLDAAVGMTEAGQVFVAWTSSTAARLETRALRESGTEAGAYIGGALHLLQVARAHVADQQWEAVKRDADRARRLAARAEAHAEARAKHRA
ncbi:hypothetical protein [Microbispora bryophytorum]|uniref:hypothetical protein n=1 Tax=Microbispora bryophytorum TaxID=1460882 RepID=UPI003406DB3C